MKAGAFFALGTLALIALSYPLLRMGFASTHEADAVRLSAMLALAVQLATFAVARAMSRENMIIGWGVGTVLRLIALTVYAFLVAPSLGLPLSAALVSLAVFLFLSMLIEPLLLAYDR
jgi:membrane protease YdiL (CAAX protease family)